MAVAVDFTKSTALLDESPPQKEGSADGMAASTARL